MESEKREKEGGRIADLSIPATATACLFLDLIKSLSVQILCSRREEKEEEKYEIEQISPRDPIPDFFSLFSCLCNDYRL